MCQEYIRVIVETAHPRDDDGDFDEDLIDDDYDEDLDDDFGL